LLTDLGLLACFVCFVVRLTAAFTLVLIDFFAAFFFAT
jgi:hypothetical protein